MAAVAAPSAYSAEDESDGSLGGAYEAPESDDEAPAEAALQRLLRRLGQSAGGGTVGVASRESGSESELTDLTDSDAGPEKPPQAPRRGARAAEVSRGSSREASGSPPPPALPRPTSMSTWSMTSKGGSTTGSRLAGYEPPEPAPVEPALPVEQRGRTLLVMDVKFGGGQRDRLVVREHDRPEDLARAFIQAHGLKDSYLRALTLHVKQSIAQAEHAASSTSSASDSDGPSEEASTSRHAASHGDLSPTASTLRASPPSTAPPTASPSTASPPLRRASQSKASSLGALSRASSSRSASSGDAWDASSEEAAGSVGVPRQEPETHSPSSGSQGTASDSPSFAGEPEPGYLRHRDSVSSDFLRQASHRAAGSHAGPEASDDDQRFSQEASPAASQKSDADAGGALFARLTREWRSGGAWTSEEVRAPAPRVAATAVLSGRQLSQRRRRRGQSEPRRRNSASLRAERRQAAACARLHDQARVRRLRAETRKLAAEEAYQRHLAASRTALRRRVRGQESEYETQGRWKCAGERLFAQGVTGREQVARRAAAHRREREAVAEGEWTCPKCTQVNGGADVVCSRVIGREVPLMEGTTKGFWVHTTVDADAHGRYGKEECMLQRCGVPRPAALFHPTVVSRGTERIVSRLASRTGHRFAAAAYADSARSVSPTRSRAAASPDIFGSTVASTPTTLADAPPPPPESIFEALYSSGGPGRRARRAAVALSEAENDKIPFKPTLPARSRALAEGRFAADAAADTWAKARESRQLKQESASARARARSRGRDATRSRGDEEAAAEGLLGRMPNSGESGYAAESPEGSGSGVVARRRSRSSVARMERDAEERRRREVEVAAMAPAVNGCTFRPDIGVNGLRLVHDATQAAQSERLCYEYKDRDAKVARARRKQARDDLDVDPVTRQPLYQPRVGRLPATLQRQEASELPPPSVHAKLYGHATKAEEAAAKRLEEADARRVRMASEARTLQRSESLLRQREVKGLSDTFDLLCRARERLIREEMHLEADAFVMASPMGREVLRHHLAEPGEEAQEWLDVNAADPTILAERHPALARLCSEVLGELKDALVSRGFFVRRMREALAAFRSRQQGPAAQLFAPRKDTGAAEEARAAEEKEMTLVPQLAPRSLKLAEGRYDGSKGTAGAAHLLCKERERYATRALHRKADMEKRRMAECTFRPALATERGRYRVRARYPNERGPPVRAWEPTGPAEASQGSGVPDEVAAVAMEELGGGADQPLTADPLLAEPRGRALEARGRTTPRAARAVRA